MSTPKGDAYVIAFALGVCLVCSLMLSAAASSLKARQDYNVELDRKINVLKAFGVPVADAKGRRLGGAEVDRIFHDSISELVIDAATGKPLEGKTLADADPKALAAKALLPLFVWKEGGVPSKYAFPVSGKGLWSTIYGYLALERDLSTIAGVTFFRHGETPGLGGECEKDWFQDNFKGKKVFAAGQRQRFEVVKGAVADRYPSGNDHAVDGISGATLTGNGIMRFVNGDLDLYEKYFSLLRSS
jgi:Na+-transporting NADH:ubiquinone oxidoreductase subunit C